MASSSIHHLGKPVDNGLTSKPCRFKVSCSAIKSGSWVWFPTFTTGDHFWRISCGPACISEEQPHEGEVTSLTFYLNYGGECKDVKVSFDLGLHKKDEAASSVMRKNIVHTFPMHGNFVIVEKLAQGYELKRCLRDDYLIVTCSVTILSASCMGSSDSGVIILSSLSGTSRNHSTEVPSSENEDLASTSLINSIGATKKEMPSGLVKFKVACSHIKEVQNFHFPIFKAAEHCWQMGCYYNEAQSYLTLYFDVHSACKDLEVNLEFGVFRKNGVSVRPSVTTWQTITNKFEKCGDNFWSSHFLVGNELNWYLQDDYLIVICNLTILSETVTSDHDVVILNRTEKPKSHFFDGPSPYLQEHLSKLLQNKERVDTTFEVNGELFHAHKLILAARSPVFSARLFGPMKVSERLFGPVNENNTPNIKVEEVEPVIFSALLHFIYTDLLPDLNYDGSIDGESNQMDSVEMFQHLLVAADCYALERLKFMCEDKLSDVLTIDTVGTTLALADQHNCASLKARCFEFITSPRNLTKVAVTDGYRDLLVSCPAILKELQERLKNKPT